MRKVAAWFKSELAGWGWAIRANPGAVWIRVGLLGLVFFHYVAVPRIVGDALFDTGGMVHRSLAGLVIAGFFIPFARPLKVQFLSLLVLGAALPALWAIGYVISWLFDGSYAARIVSAKFTTNIVCFAFLYAMWFCKWNGEAKEPQKSP